MKIRVQTIDGDVDYYDISKDFCLISEISVTVCKVLLREKYYPDYRLEDIQVSFV